MKFKGVGDIRYISSTLWNPRPDSKTKKGGSWEKISVRILNIFRQLPTHQILGRQGLGLGQCSGDCPFQQTLKNPLLFFPSSTESCKWAPV